MRFQTNQQPWRSPLCSHLSYLLFGHGVLVGEVDGAGLPSGISLRRWQWLATPGSQLQPIVGHGTTCFGGVLVKRAPPPPVSSLILPTRPLHLHSLALPQPHVAQSSQSSHFLPSIPLTSPTPETWGLPSRGGTHGINVIEAVWDNWPSVPHSFVLY